MSAGRALAIRLGGQPVGRLERRREGAIWWFPEALWEAGGQRPRLGLQFLRNPGPQRAGTGLPPWFENLLPESGGEFRSRLAAAQGLRDSDSFGLLGALGRDLPGAVDALPQPGGEASVELAAEAGGGEPGAAKAAEGPPAQLRFSLAGMQLKLSMAARGERLALPARGEAGGWIVKLPGRAYPELPAVEAATMAWARAAGLEVPSHAVVGAERLEGLPAGWLDHCPTAYAIERFDRRSDGTRIHHEDFCQALGLLPQWKYGDASRLPVSLDGALKLVVDAAGEEEGRRFAHRVGFVIASGNDDAHLKNWSFAWGGAERPALSPCYDLVATISWPRHGWSQPGGPTLALALGRVRRFALLDGEALHRHGARSGQPWAAEAVREGIVRARTAFPAIADQVPSIMREALAAHWRQVPLLRDAGPLAAGD